MTTSGSGSVWPRPISDRPGARRLLRRCVANIAVRSARPSLPIRGSELWPHHHHSSHVGIQVGFFRIPQAVGDRSSLADIRCRSPVFAAFSTEQLTDLLAPRCAGRRQQLTDRRLQREVVLPSRPVEPFGSQSGASLCCLCPRVPALPVGGELSAAVRARRPHRRWHRPPHAGSRTFWPAVAKAKPVADWGSAACARRRYPGGPGPTRIPAAVLLACVHGTCLPDPGPQTRLVRRTGPRRDLLAGASAARRAPMAPGPPPNRSPSEHIRPDRPTESQAH